jgi:hypothetical protein
MQDIFFEMVEILISDEKTFKNFTAAAAKRQRRDDAVPRKMTTKPLGEMDSEELYDLIERESQPEPSPAEMFGVKDVLDEKG